MRIVFERVKLKGVKRWIDADGKKHQRTRTFEQTLNPYNLYAGRPKTRERILIELARECSAWMIQEGI
jgi:hypothetical protein